MPRNAAGTYSLPAGNPVVTATVISSVWANTTLSDIGTEITDSLDRSGKGGMLASLQLASGVIGAPGLSWTAETTSGLYRAGAGDFRYSIAAADKLQITTNGIRTADGTVGAPGFSFISDTDIGMFRGGADDIRFVVGSSTLPLKLLNTAGNVQVLIADGVVGTPGISFVNDTDTGIYRAGANDMRFNTGGAARIIIQDTLVEIGAGVVFHIQDGAVGAPGLQFANDPDTGIYRIGSNNPAMSAGGVSVQTWDVQGAQFFDGVVGTPGISFISDRDTGFYRSGSGNVIYTSNAAISVQFSGGATRFGDGFASGDRLVLFNNVARSAANLEFYINYSALQLRLYGYDGAATTGGTFRIDPQLLIQDGVVGTPGIAFTSDPNTGFYRVGADNPAIVAGGVLSLAFDPGHARFGDGAAGTPSATFDADTDTGIFRNGSGTIRFSSNGTEMCNVNASGFQMSAGAAIQILAADGAVGSPGYAWGNDADSGFYKSTVDQIAIALGGITYGQIATGTYTGTLTGCTTAPTVTIRWAQVGPHMLLFVPAITATSNTTACTITGGPAAINPTRTQSVPISELNDNTVLINTGSVTMTAASGTITLKRAGNAAGFTAAGTKGIPVDSVIYYYML